MDTFSQLEDLLASQDSRFPLASSFLAHLGAPSTSFAILEDGKITSHMITTLNDNTETRFQACSISKPVGTAMSVFRLVEADNIKLDVPISTYLPPADLELISGPATRELTGTITIRQLLSHTSGLGTHGFPGYNTKTSRIPTTREILAGSSPPVNTLQVELQSFPGHRFSYSGGGTTVVQLILENMMGKPFAEVVQELVLDPLSMTQSTYRYPSDEEINGLLKPGKLGSGNFARAYLNAGMPCDVPQHALPEAGAAGLWTTPTDLLKTIRGIQMSLLGAEGAFISQALAEDVLKPIQANHAPGFMNVGGIFGHGGSNDPGWRCMVVGSSAVAGSTEKIMGLPPGCGISIMSNSACGSQHQGRLLSAICYLKGWGQISKDFAHVPKDMVLADPKRDIGDAWKAWIGKHGDGWELADLDGKPVVSLNGSPPMLLLAVAQPGSNGSRLKVQSLEMVVSLVEKNGKKVLDVATLAEGSWEG